MYKVSLIEKGVTVVNSVRNLCKKSYLTLHYVSEGQESMRIDPCFSACLLITCGPVSMSSSLP